MSADPFPSVDQPDFGPRTPTSQDPAAEGLRFRKASKDAATRPDSLKTTLGHLSTPDSGLDLDESTVNRSWPSLDDGRPSALKPALAEEDDEAPGGSPSFHGEGGSPVPPVQILSEALRRRRQEERAQQVSLTRLIPYAVVLVLLASSVFAVLFYKSAMDRTSIEEGSMEAAANGKYAAIAYGAKRAQERLGGEEGAEAEAEAETQAEVEAEAEADGEGQAEAEAEAEAEVEAEAEAEASHEPKMKRSATDEDDPFRFLPDN